MKANMKAGIALAGMTKDHGPPHRHYNKSFDPLESNEYLMSQGVDLEALRNAHPKRHVEVSHHH